MADNVIAMQVDLVGVDKAVSGFKSIGESLEKLGKTKDKVSKDSSKLGGAFGKLKSAGSGLKGTFSNVFENGIGKSIKGSLGAVKEFGGAVVGAISPVGWVAGAAAAGMAVGNFVNSSINAARDLESSMNMVYTMLPGISKEAMKGMKNDVIDLSTKYGRSATEMSGAMYQALSAGVSKDNVKGFLETAQKGAIAGVTDVTTAVDGLSSVVNAWGEKSISAAQASDLMFTAVKNGKTTFGEMASSIAQVSPIASSLGVKFSDVTAGIATLTAKGTPTSEVMTQMKAAFSEFSKGSSSASKEFKKATGQSFQEFIAKGGNLQTAMQALEAHSKKTGKNINEFFGSVEAGSLALSLTGENTAAFTKNMQDMAKSQGATEQAFNQMNQGIGPTMEKLGAQFDAVKLKIGDALAPTFMKIGNSILNVVPAVEQFFASIGKSQTAQVLLQSLGNVGTMMSSHLKAGFSVVMSVVNAVIPIFSSFVSAMGLTGSSGQQLAGIVSSVFSTIGSIISGVIAFITPILVDVAQVLGVILGGAIRGLIDSFRFFAKIISTVGGFFKKLFGKEDAEKTKQALDEVKKGMEEINAEAEKPTTKQIDINKTENITQTVTQQPLGGLNTQNIQMPPIKLDPTAKVPIDPLSLSSTQMKIDPSSLANTQMKVDPTAFNSLQSAVQQVGSDIKSNPLDTSRNSLLGELKAEISSLKAEFSGLKAEIGGLKGVVEGTKGAIVGKLGEVVGAVRAIKLEVNIPPAPSASDIANRIAGSLQKG